MRISEERERKGRASDASIELYSRRRESTIDVCESNDGGCFNVRLPKYPS